MLIHFTKMEGCGNDYVYVNGISQSVPSEIKPELTLKQVSRLISCQLFSAIRKSFLFVPQPVSPVIMRQDTLFFRWQFHVITIQA